jgi:Mor family transcriptional regulator
MATSDMQTRDLAILKMHEEGKRYPEIGREFHLTAARICQIVKRIKSEHVEAA